MTAWSFFLKLCCNTFCCAVDDKIFSPTSFAVSTFPLIPALIPVAMLRKRQLSLNEFRDSRNSNSSHESVISFTCLAIVKSLCCSLVLYYTPVCCWIALFTSAQTGCAINQTRRWVSVMPGPLVKPPLVFMLRMRTCSLTRAGKLLTRTDLICVQRGALGRSVWTHLDGFHEACASAASIYECISCTSYVPMQLNKASYHTLLGCGVLRCPSVLV